MMLTISQLGICFVFSVRFIADTHVLRWPSGIHGIPSLSSRRERKKALPSKREHHDTPAIRGCIRTGL